MKIDPNRRINFIEDINNYVPEDIDGIFSCLEPISIPKRMGKLVIVSNRLPIVSSRDSSGKARVMPGAGGLVTALKPILSSQGGRWIGWPGTSDGGYLNQGLGRVGEEMGCSFRPVTLSEEEINKYYLSFSNRILWPVFHGLLSHCQLDLTSWNTYRQVNTKFAEVVIRNTTENDYVWVHDFHLLLVGKELRKMGFRGQIGFFLHIPFPPVNTMKTLPWCSEILKSMLQYDLIGFQTADDQDNFTQTVGTFLGDSHIERHGNMSIINLAGYRTKVGTFPISIDYDDFSRRAARQEVVDKVVQIRKANAGRRIILGVDRLDYTKGIPHRLRAFRKVLESHAELTGGVTLIQVVVPNREEIPDYQRLKSEIEGLVGEINDSFARPGWQPVQYIYGSVGASDLLAHYQAADVALVTPLKDGMNLVAKEYCATHNDSDGVLVLSEFAGAARQLGKDALLVNPYDIDHLAGTIYHALRLEIYERNMRMMRLRKLIQEQDIYWWANLFLENTDYQVNGPETLTEVPLVPDVVC